jgi:hypothetical protein
MRESKIEKYFCREVKKRGGEVRKVKWLDRNGAPDRVAFFPGHAAIWIEFKAPGKKLRPEQKREHKRLNKVGQIVKVIDSKRAVDNFFKGLDDIIFGPDLRIDTMAERYG